MPSPFPGMDPYLEGNWWTTFHAFLAPQLAAQLNPLLRPKYIAAPERQYVSGSREDIFISPAGMIPDVGVRRTRNRSTPKDSTATGIAPALKLRSHARTRVPHYRIEIRDALKRQLVTAIELLSPTHKRSGRKAYLRKRNRFLRSSAHLLEIDLQHQGRRIPLLDPYPQGAYFVLLNRARKRLWTEVWAIAIHDHLPTVPVPLLKGDADVALDLQAAFSRVYEEGNFDLALDYQKPPDVDLSDEEAHWLDEHLRTAGMRK